MTYGVMLLKIWIEGLLPFSYENMKKLFQFVSKMRMEVPTWVMKIKCYYVCKVLNISLAPKSMQ